MHYYESHLGGLFTSCDRYDYDELYCDECGDSDWYIGEFDTPEDFIKSINPETDFYTDPEYLSEFTGIPVEKILELNPKLTDEYMEHLMEEEESEE